MPFVIELLHYIAVFVFHRFLTAVAGREVHAVGVVIAVVRFVRHRERAGT